MADRLQLVVTLRKDVPNEATARTLLNLVKTRFEDQPEIIVTGHLSIHYDVQEG